MDEDPKPESPVFRVSQSSDSLHKAIFEAQALFKPVYKSHENPFYKSKYADLGDTWDAVYPALTKCGLLFMQLPTSLGLLSRLVHVESGEYMECLIEMLYDKDGPQGFGSSLSYYRRYVLSSMLMICPEEDDGNIGQKGKTAEKEKAEPAKKLEIRTNVTEKSILADIAKAKTRPVLERAYHELNAQEDWTQETYDSIFAKLVEKKRSLGF